MEELWIGSNRDGREALEKEYEIYYRERGTDSFTLWQVGMPFDNLEGVRKYVADSIVSMTEEEGLNPEFRIYVVIRAQIS